MAPGFASTLALVSSVPMALLGLWLLFLEPRRSEQVFFGLFSVLWGLKVAAANVGLVFESAAVFETGFLLNFALGPPAYLFLAQSTALIHGGRRSWLLPAGMGLVAAAAMAVLIADPSLVLANVAEAPDGGVGDVELGPAAFPLFAVPFFGVFYITLGSLYLRYRRSEPGSSRHRYRGMLVALALFTSYQTVTNLLNFGLGDLPTSVAGWGGDWLAVGLFTGGALFLLGLLGHAAVRPATPGDRDWLVLGSFLVPGAVASVTELWGAIPPSAHTWGLWRLLMVAVLVHAIARHRLFDLDLKLKRWAAPGLAAGVLGLAGLVGLLQATGSGSTRAWLQPLAFGALAAGGLVLQRDRVGRMLFPDVSEDPAYVEQRKAEVYQAALEGVLEDGDDPDEDPLLADLRRSLGVSRSTHEAMVARLREPGSVADAGLPPIEPGATLLDRYHVDRLIGEGGHGRAFLAWDETEGREVVLKVVGKPVLGGEAVQRLLREAETMGAIDHPNVLDVYEVVEGRHELVLVSEYASGGSLADLVARRGKLGVSRSLEVIDQVLQGLSAAHAEGVVHRDVKPENILLADDGVRVADFGIAQRSDGSETKLTAGPVGTLLYMSPEQVRGGAVDERSDLYAVGVVLHRILTGGFYIPTSGADDFVLRQRILEDPPDLDPEDVPARIREVLETALAKAPEERFGSAEAMRQALDGAASVEASVPAAG